jgi:glycosyltransferase involved in cell wall biosynthesis
MNEKKPKVSVVMPVYNSELYVAEAIESILTQTFTDFEFIILNDGSTDKSREIIQKYADRDSRIIFLDHTDNTGYVVRLNQGIAQARGEYVARMDNDDISYPTRFAKQVAYLDSHPRIALVGSSTDTLKDGVVAKGWTLRATPAETSVHFLFTNYVMHPTVMMRKTMIPKEGYDMSFYIAEDFELWTRILHEQALQGNPASVWSFPEPLLAYRTHAQGMSTLNKPRGYESASRVLKRQLEWLGLQPTDDEVEMHHQISDFHTEKYSLDQIDGWFWKLWEANLKAKKKGAKQSDAQKYPSAILLSTIVGRRLVISKKGLLGFTAKFVVTLGPVEWVGFVRVSLKKGIKYLL